MASLFDFALGAVAGGAEEFASQKREEMKSESELRRQQSLLDLKRQYQSETARAEAEQKAALVKTNNPEWAEGRSDAELLALAQGGFLDSMLEARDLQGKAYEEAAEKAMRQELGLELSDEEALERLGAEAFAKESGKQRARPDGGREGKTFGSPIPMFDPQSGDTVDVATLEEFEMFRELGFQRQLSEDTQFWKTPDDIRMRQLPGRSPEAFDESLSEWKPAGEVLGREFDPAAIAEGRDPASTPADPLRAAPQAAAPAARPTPMAAPQTPAQVEALLGGAGGESPVSPPTPASPQIGTEASASLEARGLVPSPDPVQATANVPETSRIAGYPLVNPDTMPTFDVVEEATGPADRSARLFGNFPVTGQFARSIIPGFGIREEQADRFVKDVERLNTRLGVINDSKPSLFEQKLATGLGIQAGAFRTEEMTMARLEDHRNKLADDLQKLTNMANNRNLREDDRATASEGAMLTLSLLSSLETVAAAREMHTTKVPVQTDRGLMEVPLGNLNLQQAEGAVQYEDITDPKVLSLIDMYIRSLRGRRGEGGF